MHGFVSLGRKFRIMDDDGSRTISLQEFKKGLRESNLHVSDSDARILFAFFDQVPSCLHFFLFGAALQADIVFLRDFDI